MRVCLLNAPWESFGRWGIRSGCRFPNLMPQQHNAYVPFPFLIAYTAAVLERAGITVMVIDGVAERCDSNLVIERIQRFQPDLIVTETATASLTHDLRFMRRIRARASEAPIALFGSHVTARPADACFGDPTDYVICGEPEDTVLALAQTLADGDDPSSLPGLAFRRPDGSLRQNPRGPLVDVKALPYPKRDGMPMFGYAVTGFPKPVMFIYGSRGCPYKCNFCLWPQTIFKSGNYRPRPAEDIVAEMVYLKQKDPSIGSFFFDDDTFNLGRRRMHRFADGLEAAGLNVPFGMNARADNWDEETMRRLVDVGLFNLRIGIESGDPRVGARAQKGVTLATIRQTLEMSNRLGISNHVSFVIGLAGETWESVQHTIDFARTIPVDSVQFSVATPFPGTALFAEADRAGLIETYDWDRYSGSSTAVMRTEAMSTAQIEEALRYARRKVYFTPRFVFRRLRYMRDARDLIAITRKVGTLLSPS